LIVQGGRGSFSEALASIAAEVEGGASLSTAMERHPNDFGALAVAMVRAGEVGGTLDRALESIAELEERDGALRKRIGASLAYPAVVTAAAAALVAFLLANTMPAFALMFAQMHVQLPLSTRVLIAAGSALSRPALWMIALAASVTMIALVRASVKSEAAWLMEAERLRLRLPVVGRILAKATIARFSRTLGALLHAGVNVVVALETSAAVLNDRIYRHGIEAIVEALGRGETLAAPFASSGLFDPTFLQLLRAGEESGNVDAMLLRLATAYELDVETGLATLTSILEPLLICVLGAVIGTIVASILIPLYSMIGAIR
jgi:type IV pilus assembly protein PilC